MNASPSGVMKVMEVMEVLERMKGCWALGYWPEGRVARPDSLATITYITYITHITFITRISLSHQ